MKRLILFFIFLILPVVHAEVENYNNVSSLTVQVDISSDIEKKDGGSVNEISAELEFYPKETIFQTILSQEFFSSPEADVSLTEESVRYTWNKDALSYSYSVSSLVQIDNHLFKVYDSVPYPFPIDETVRVYTLETEVIDITPEIDTLAEELVGGEDDFYQAVFILANWTQNNIAYNLSTLNIEASQKSSYVLEHKEGVCDELTNLFISLARSRGIPARFVSGVVYSNIGHSFGPHGWAEVYIDGQWVPIDVTFGTFGWIDPSHVKFKDELGSNDASVSYEWSGKDLDIKVGEIDLQTSIKDAEGAAETYLDISVDALEDSVGSGSYVPIQITLSNDHSFYVPVQLYLTKAPGVVGSNTKSILLEPKESTSVFWILEVPEDLDPNYLYTSTIEIQSMYGGVARTNFSYAESYPVMNLAEAEDILSSLVIDEEKPYLDDVSLDCAFDKDLYSSDEEAQLVCSAEGELDGVVVCFEEQCFSASSSLEWTLDLDKYESQRIMVDAERNEEARYTYLDLNIVKNSNLRIENLEPETIDFRETSIMSFDLVTDSSLQNITLTIQDIGSFTLSSLQAEKHITLEVQGKDVSQEKITFFMEYTDALGNMYSTEETKYISVSNIPWYYRFLNSFLRLF